MSDDYIFELAHSKSRERIGELTKAKDKQLQLVHNKAGAFTFRLPLKDDASEDIEEVETCVRIKRRLPSGAYKREWEGPVWTVEEATPDLLQVGCVGWLQTLEKRVTKPVGTTEFPSWTTLQYADVDAGYIALDLLRQSNGDTSYADGNYVEPGSYEPTQPRTKAYQPWSSVLEEIHGLAELEAGFYYDVSPDTRELNVYRTIGKILNDVVFEYGGNSLAARRSADASKICNRCIAYSSIGYAVAEDPSSIADLGLFEEAVSLTEVVDATILQAYANGEVALRSRPLRMTGFDPRRASSAYPEDPRPLRNFRVGDVVFHTVDRGRLRVVKQAHKIFGMTIDWDDGSGKEKASNIQTTAS